MFCLIHDEGPLTRPFGVCKECRIESHRMMEEMTKKGELPAWIWNQHRCEICDDLENIEWVK